MSVSQSLAETRPIANVAKEAIEEVFMLEEIGETVGKSESKYVMDYSKKII